MSNKRKYERYNLQLAVYLKDKRGTNKIRTGNISKYGLFLVTPQPKPERQLIQLVIEFPHKAETINVLAQVMWVDETGTSERSGGLQGMGVKFFSMPDQERQNWEAFVDQVRTGRVRLEEAPAPVPNLESGEDSSIYTIGDEELEELEDLDIDEVTESIEEEILDIEEDEGEAYSDDLSAAEAEYESGKGAFDAALAASAEDRERRDFPRKPVAFLVKMRDVGSLRQLFTRDISLGGMFLKTQIEKPLNTAVEVMIVHPWTNEEFPLEAIVRRIERSETGSIAGLGVEFSGVDDDLRDSILMFIESGFAVFKREPDSPIESAVIARIEGVEARIKANPIDAALHFELGLLYLGLSDWERFNEHVGIAEKLGYEVPEEVSQRIRDGV